MIKWILAVVLPWILCIIFVKLISRQWLRLEPDMTSDLDDFGFPNIGNTPVESAGMCVRKMGIWYVLFTITMITGALIPLIGNLVYIASQIFMIFLFVSQSVAVSKAKKTQKKINPAIRRSYTPVVNILRLPAIYQFVMYFLYVTFVDILSHA